MKETRLEPGVLNLFRLFLVLQLVLIYVNVAGHTARGYLQGCPWCAVAFGTVSTTLLLVYLSIPWFQKKLGAWHLPIALILTAVVSLAAQNFFLYFTAPAGTGGGEETAWQLFLFLFIPLVLISWQYDFKAVVAFILFTSLLDYFFLRFGRDDYLLLEATYKRLIFVRGLSFLIAGYIISRVVTQMRQQRVALEEANLKLAHYAATLEHLVVSRERNRLARELHDTLAHTLSGLAVQLEGIRSLWGTDPQGAHDLLDRSLDATRTGLTETRTAIQSLRAAPIDDLGIVLALRELAQGAAERAGFALSFSAADAPENLSADVEQCLYRVAQEALENIVRHAQAENVTVDLRRENGSLALTISDDGLGFKPEAVDPQTHYGLRGLCERAELVRGEVEIESAPGAGTRVRLEVER